MKASERLKQQQQRLNSELDKIDATEYFEQIPDMIRERIRAGLGINESGELRELKPLAESTILRRERLDREGLLSDETSPMSSNLTESGNMLDSIMFKKKGKKYSIDFDNRRTRNGVKPSELKDYNEEKGRKFFGLAKVERDFLDENIKKKIEQVIKKIFR